MSSYHSYESRYLANLSPNKIVLSDKPSLHITIDDRLALAVPYGFFLLRPTLLWSMALQPTNTVFFDLILKRLKLCVQIFLFVYLLTFFRKLPQYVSLPNCVLLCHYKHYLGHYLFFIAYHFTRYKRSHSLKLVVNIRRKDSDKTFYPFHRRMNHLGQ